MDKVIMCHYAIKYIVPYRSLWSHASFAESEARAGESETTWILVPLSRKQGDTLYMFLGCWGLEEGRWETATNIKWGQQPFCFPVRNLATTELSAGLGLGKATEYSEAQRWQGVSKAVLDWRHWAAEGAVGVSCHGIGGSWRQSKGPPWG